MFSPEGAPEVDTNVEQFADWEQLRDNADAQARSLLEAHGLTVELDAATPEEMTYLIKDLPEIIDELSFNEDGSVKNENRFVVPKLAAHLEKAKRKRAYDAVPSIAA